MKPIYQLRNEIQITDFCLHREGIEIEYIMKGQDYKLILDKDQACEMLKEIGTIEDYWNGDVFVEHDWNDKVRIAEMSYEAFVLSYTMSQHEALSIVAVDFDRQQTAKWAGEIKSIPGMIVDMTKPETYFDQVTGVNNLSNKINYGI